jgi:hypothetical protein
MLDRCSCPDSREMSWYGFHRSRPTYFAVKEGLVSQMAYEPMLIGHVCCLAGKQELAVREGILIGAGLRPNLSPARPTLL